MAWQFLQKIFCPTVQTLLYAGRSEGRQRFAFAERRFPLTQRFRSSDKRVVSNRRNYILRYLQKVLQIYLIVGLFYLPVYFYFHYVQINITIFTFCNSDFSSVILSYYMSSRPTSVVISTEAERSNPIFCHWRSHETHLLARYAVASLLTTNVENLDLLKYIIKVHFLS